MSKGQFDFIEEIQLFTNFALSPFSKKYKNEWLCIVVGLPLIYLFDYPLFFINFLNHLKL